MNGSIFVGTSLDGYIARLDGSLDFLPPDGEVDYGYDEFVASVDVIIIGRNTYDGVRGLLPWPYGAKPVVVLSTRVIAQPPAGTRVEQMEGPPHEILALLAAQGFKHAYVDGGLTIQSFLRARVIQRLTIIRVPVLIGSGIALFGPTMGDVALKHLRTQQYPSGLVRSDYEVVA